MTAPYLDEHGARIISREIALATARGVNVRIVGREIMTKNPNQVSIAGLGILVKQIAQSGDLERLQIRDYHVWGCVNGFKHSSVHAKILIADRRRAYLGSANFTEYSLRSNFEVDVILKRNSVRGLLEVVDRLWSISRSVPADIIIG